MYYALPRDSFPEAFALGMIITGSLPTTFDTSVIFVRAAGGDEATAVLNGTFSNLVGIFLTPALLFIQLRSTLSISAIVSTLIKLIEVSLTPVVLGQLTRVAIT